MCESVDPYAWQDEAIEAWSQGEPPCRGIVEAIPGSGKTNVAFKAMQYLRQHQGPPVNTIIVVPTIPLMNQWFERLCEEFPGESFGRIGGGHHDDFSNARETGALPMACVAVVNSAVARIFPNYPDVPLQEAQKTGILGHCLRGRNKSFLIADECHHYIYEDLRRNRRVLDFPFDFTLGLSATIKPYNVEGLGTIVYTLDMARAGQTGLVPHFDIINVPMTLTQHEKNEYLELSDRIADQMMKVKDIFSHELNGLSGELMWRKLRAIHAERTTDGEPDENAAEISKLFNNLFKRAKICYLCQEKLSFAPKLVGYLVDKLKKKVLVFFERIWSAESAQKDISVASAKRLSVAITEHSYDGGGIWCKVYHSGMSRDMRNQVLCAFRSAGPSALCVCRALDEGLDVPSVDAVVLVASTQSERQRLQRIGRALRSGDGHKKPLVFILYARGTRDDEVRVLPGNEDFAPVATIHEVSPREALEIVDDNFLHEPPVPAVDARVPDGEWYEVVACDPDEPLTPEQAHANLKHLKGEWVQVHYVTGAVARGHVSKSETNYTYFMDGGNITNDKIIRIDCLRGNREL